jgi:hypothetical protein
MSTNQYKYELESLLGILQNPIFQNPPNLPSWVTGSLSSDGINLGGTPTSIPSNKYSVTSTPLLRKAVLDQADYIFTPKGGANDPKPKDYQSPTGEISGLCAGFTYNIALKIKEHINKKSNTYIKQNWTSGGHAYLALHLNNIENLGIYDKYYIGRKSKSEIEKYINSQTWNYGDIINYHSVTNEPVKNYHTQIYTGDIYQSSNYLIRGKNQFKTAPKSGWSTSNKTNYGTSFVYKSPGPFEFYVFKIKNEYLK